MNGVDSSFEALAFIPVNLSPLFSAAVNSLWAFLAVVTAAISFWCFRTSSLKTSRIPLPPPPRPRKITCNDITIKTSSFKAIEDEREEYDENDDEKVVLTRGNSKKFLTVIYEERETDDHVDDDDDEMDGGDELDQDHDEDDVDIDNNDEDECVVIKRWGSTGSTVEMIRSLSSSSVSSSSSSEFDLGWYSYQDRKVIDGSVVRLWEEERDTGSCGSASPRGCRRRCFAGVTTQLALA